MKKVLCALAAVILIVGCGDKGKTAETDAQALAAMLAESGEEAMPLEDVAGEYMPKRGSFIDDRDDKKYRTIRIGEQVWMAENLNYKTDSSWCYDDDTSNCNKYGRLYAWNAAMKACPTGWHLPAQEEWDGMVPSTSADHWETDGTKLKSKLPNWNGTDNYGFSAMPGGEHHPYEMFQGLGEWGYWWTQREIDDGGAIQTVMGTNTTGLDRHISGKGVGSSVRCLRD